MVHPRACTFPSKSIWVSNAAFHAAISTTSYGSTLKDISVVMVNPCVITGSSSAVRPFQQSNSTQRQPDKSTWRYISTEELPASCPAARSMKEGDPLWDYGQGLTRTKVNSICFPVGASKLTKCVRSIIRCIKPNENHV